MIDIRGHVIATRIPFSGIRYWTAEIIAREGNAAGRLLDSFDFPHAERGRVDALNWAAARTQAMRGEIVEIDFVVVGGDGSKRRSTVHGHRHEGRVRFLGTLPLGLRAELRTDPTTGRSDWRTS